MSYVSRDKSLWFNWPGVVAAWQAVNAPGPSQSLWNQKNGGVNSYTLISSAYPNWSAAKGWIFNGSTFLDTGYIRVAGTRVACFVYVGSFGSLAYKFVFGTKNATHNPQGVQKYLATNTLYWSGSGGYTSHGPVIHDNMVVGYGWYKLPPFGDSYAAYADGAYYAGSRYNDLTYPSIYIGGYNNNGTLAGGLDCTVKAFLILDGGMPSDARTFNLMRQMRYCDVNPDWSVWGRRRRWFYAAATAAARPTWLGEWWGG